MPDNVRALRGRTSHTTPTRQAVTAPPQAPNPPTTLDREAAAEWRRVVKVLDAQGVLSLVDRAVLTSHCEGWSTARQARKQLNEEGLVLIDADGVSRKNPAWQIYREANVQMMSAAKELFITPAARTRIRVPKGDADDQAEGETVLD